MPLDSARSNVNVVWSPLPGSQTTVLSHDWVFEILYHGTRGPGKSDTLLMCFAKHVGKGWGPEWRGIIFRRTYKELQDLINKSKKWFKRIWPDAKYNISDNSWTFPTGEQLFFRYYARDSDYDNYHGHAYPFIGWDELTNWPTDSGYKRMMSCCRSTVDGIPKMYRATTNPYGVGHNWVKFHFELPAKESIIRSRTYSFENPITGQTYTEVLDRLAVHGNIYENTILLNADPTYIAQLRESARNEAELKAWLEGSWDIVAGGMFDDVWNPKYNVVKRFRIPDTWRIKRSFDWGSSAPFSVGFWAESDGSDIINGNGVRCSTLPGDLFRVAEWYGWSGKPNEGLKMLNAEIGAGIYQREQVLFPGRKVLAGPADNQITQIVNGKSIAMDMAKGGVFKGRRVPGVTFTSSDKAKGSRVVGWEKMRALMVNARVDPDSGGREFPGFFVFDTCDQFIRTVPVLPRCDKNPDDINSEAEDHIADDSRYMVLDGGRTIRGGRVTGLTH